MFIELMGENVRSALSSQVMLLDKMRNVLAFARLVLDVGKDVAEVAFYYNCLLTKLNFPQLNDAAKVVVGLVDRLFKVRRLLQRPFICPL